MRQNDATLAIPARTKFIEKSTRWKDTERERERDHSNRIFGVEWYAPTLLTI